MTSCQPDEAINALQTCIGLLQASEDSPYSSLTTAELIVILQQAVSMLQQQPVKIHPDLRVLFAPTGPMQETAIGNDWPSDFEVATSIINAYASDG
ncbi:MAG TPA: hypothetical protein DDY14_17735 [Chromatiaceae bacterium]|jgi:hypothetical protein|nr:MAG: hypothetical protein N838_01505 [Thiohalocapsa sp. PB-PSB1]QQO55008.1 MAG: hypothetical protein N838_18280 [Thiohalocapsa sp. PB-PSB1]HBG97121.1 hypothetical protein [Chromatiaceae bacterium]